jgi:hypothetical protein
MSHENEAFFLGVQALRRSQAASDSHDAYRRAPSALQSAPGRRLAVGGHLELPCALLYSYFNDSQTTALVSFSEVFNGFLEHCT